MTFAPGTIRQPRVDATRASVGGFSLTELLIVIGIIVLMATIAVPLFKTMTGSRSTESAQNQLSAVLGRARLEAMGLQEVRGVMFYRDPETQRVGAALVRQVPPPVDPTPLEPAQIQPTVYLDLVPSRDLLLLPESVSVHLVDDPGAVTTDRYIGFNTIGSNAPTNTAPATVVPYGGVILFDGMGKLTSLYYALRLHVDPDGAANPANPATPTEMARFLYNAPNLTGNSAAAAQSLIRNQTLKSQFGFVVFDDEAFKTQEYTDTDPQVTNSTYSPSPEEGEELWIDDNAVPQLINRYNGTLLRGE